MHMIFVLSFKLLEEADLDENGYLSYAEFENVIARSPEFMKWVDRSTQATVLRFSLHCVLTLPILELEFQEILFSRSQLSTTLSFNSVSFLEKFNLQ